MKGVQIHDFDFNALMEFVKTAQGNVFLKTDEGDVLNLKSQLTALLVLSGALEQGEIREATVECERSEDESRLFRMNLYGEA
ncbi:MAG: hypothetical protein E7527_01720 [Ruminococcaceae bacterium]|nr:hypothetical protein [Oscillospiraceae bacterium]